MNDRLAAFLEKKTEETGLKKTELKRAVIGTNPFVSKCQMMYCKNTKNLEKVEIQEYNTNSGEYHKVEKWICPACKSKANKATYL
jgi:hypothetical protein